MPKRVDHCQRRTEILLVFLTLAAEKGLHNTSLRMVASSAKISLRQVQYYFGTKDALVQAGLELLEQQSYNGVQERLTTLPDSCSCRDTLLALLEEAMPTDKNSQQFHLLWMSYAIFSLTKSYSLTPTQLKSPNNLQRHIKDLIKRGIDDGEFHRTLDIEVEAITLLVLINGLGNAVLLGQQSVENATKVFELQLDRFKNNI